MSPEASARQPWARSPPPDVLARVGHSRLGPIGIVALSATLACARRPSPVASSAVLAGSPYNVRREVPVLFPLDLGVWPGQSGVLAARVESAHQIGRLVVGYVGAKLRQCVLTGGGIMVANESPQEHQWGGLGDVHEGILVGRSLVTKSY
jgi:hypothetical protein